jgi:hypothetical protein
MRLPTRKGIQGLRNTITCNMDLDEIKLAFEVVATRNDCEKVLEVTGEVTWQV